jgi:hypothetical protein
MDADADLKRLADAADALERQAGELRVEIEKLAGAVRENAAAEKERAQAERDRAAEAPQAAEKPASAALAVDESDARLVAYSMVLDGKPRDEVAAQLREEFGLDDSAALLDDVYARAG